MSLALSVAPADTENEFFYGSKKDQNQLLWQVQSSVISEEDLSDIRMYTIIEINELRAQTKSVQYFRIQPLKNESSLQQAVGDTVIVWGWGVSKDNRQSGKSSSVNYR
jgi:hypothetical protein